jgi:transcriptional repressor NrdR
VRCPYCADGENRVVDSRLGRDDTEIRRRRECLECGRRFTTRERVEDVLPKIVKRDERREDFDRRKLLVSIEKACAKRPVSIDALERLCDRIEKRLQEAGQTEVASGRVGEWVLEELIQIDAMAAARFASVFRGFESAADYADFFASVQSGLYATAEAGFAASEVAESEAPEAPRRPSA